MIEITCDDVREMSLLQLNAAVAELIMGCRWWKIGEKDYLWVGEPPFMDGAGNTCSECVLSSRPDDFKAWNAPYYSSDADLIRTVEHEIAAMSLETEYIRQLARVLDLPRGWFHGMLDIFAVVNADPEEKSRAALLAVLSSRETDSVREM